jgi:hypothetical protein
VGSAHRRRHSFLAEDSIDGGIEQPILLLLVRKDLVNQQVVDSSHCVELVRKTLGAGCIRAKAVGDAP